MTARPRVVAIVGPTASGKTALSLRAAERIDAEIVSADSRLVYRGMDIGTAKPTSAERARVRHHLIDVVDPGERYDVSRYQRDARAALADIGSRARSAIVVGGTGLYVRALLDGLALRELPTDPVLRRRLEEEALRDGGAGLHARLAAADPEAAASVDPRNARRVVRYLELALLLGSVSDRRRMADPIPASRIGLAPPRGVLDRAIDERVRAMVRDGVLEETRALLAGGLDPTLPSMSAHGYLHWMRFLRGEVDLETAMALTARDVRAYSRRQMTWFRREPVTWVDPTAADPLDAVLGVAA